MRRTSVGTSAPTVGKVSVCAALFTEAGAVGLSQNIPGAKKRER